MPELKAWDPIKLEWIIFFFCVNCVAWNFHLNLRLKYHQFGHFSLISNIHSSVNFMPGYTWRIDNYPIPNMGVLRERLMQSNKNVLDYYLGNKNKRISTGVFIILLLGPTEPWRLGLWAIVLSMSPFNRWLTAD